MMFSLGFLLFLSVVLTAGVFPKSKRPKWAHRTLTALALCAILMMTISLVWALLLLAMKVLP